MCVCLDQILCELTELRVLYLHGNAIWNVSEVDKLRGLQCLHTITLHGNAIETEKGYRWGLDLHRFSVTHSAWLGKHLAIALAVSG